MRLPVVHRNYTPCGTRPYETTMGRIDRTTVKDTLEEVMDQRVTYKGWNEHLNLMRINSLHQQIVTELIPVERRQEARQKELFLTRNEEDALKFDIKCLNSARNGYDVLASVDTSSVPPAQLVSHPLSQDEGASHNDEQPSDVRIEIAKRFNNPAPAGASRRVCNCDELPVAA